MSNLSDVEPVPEPALPHKPECANDPERCVMLPSGTYAVFLCLACGAHTWHMRQHVAAKAYRREGRRLVARLPVIRRLFAWQ